MCAPQGTAFLWAAPAFGRRLVPAVMTNTSVFEVEGSWAADLVYCGTRDYSNYAAIPAAFVFRDSLPGGAAAAMAYVHAITRWAGSHLAETWGTSVMPMCESEQPCNLTNGEFGHAMGGEVILMWPLMVSYRDSRMECTGQGRME